MGQEYHNLGILEHHNLGILEHHNLGMLELEHCRLQGVPHQINSFFFLKNFF